TSVTETTSFSQFCAGSKTPARYTAGMIDRRHVLLLGAAALAGLNARAALATSMSRVTAYAFTFKGLDGDEILFSSSPAHPLLVCGPSPSGGQHRVALRLHPAIRRTADPLDALS